MSFVFGLLFWIGLLAFLIALYAVAHNPPGDYESAVSQVGGLGLLYVLVYIANNVLTRVGRAVAGVAGYSPEQVQERELTNKYHGKMLEKLEEYSGPPRCDTCKNELRKPGEELREWFYKDGTHAGWSCNQCLLNSMMSKKVRVVK